MDDCEMATKIVSFWHQKQNSFILEYMCIKLFDNSNWHLFVSILVWAVLEKSMLPTTVSCCIQHQRSSSLKFVVTLQWNIRLLPNTSSISSSWFMLISQHIVPFCKLCCVHINLSGDISFLPCVSKIEILLDLNDF